MAKHPDLFFDRKKIDQIPSKRVQWKASHRLQSERHPPVEYFERVSDKDDRKILDDLEGLTDPVARQAIGHISLVPRARRVFGINATAVMAPFVRASRDNPSRFTDGSYGVYYAGHLFETALREVAYHRARFHAMTNDPPTKTTFKTIVAGIDKTLHDLRKGKWTELLDPDPMKYALPQSIAAQLKEAGSNGIVYPSVRHARGQCVGVFWPNVIKLPIIGKRVALKWNGTRIDSWFDFETSEWIEI